MAKETRTDRQNIASPAVSLPPSATATTTQRRRGNTPLTPEEKAARKAELAAEPKGAKFLRLVRYRMPKVRKAIRQIAHLANRSSYEWSQETVNKVCADLEKWVKEVRDRFAGNKENGDSYDY